MPIKVMVNKGMVQKKLFHIPNIVSYALFLKPS